MTGAELLFQTIEQGDVERLRVVLEEGDLDLDHTFKSDFHALAQAALFPRATTALEMCQELETRGAHPAAPTQEAGRTALMIMVRHRKLNARLYDRWWRTVNNADIAGKTALMFAVGDQGGWQRAGHAQITRHPISIGANPSQ